MLKTIRTGFALAFVALTGCAAQPAAETAAANAPRPAMWKVADEDTTLYLFGTFHLLPENHHWRTPAFEAASI